MREFDEFLNGLPPFSTVMVAGRAEDGAHELLTRLAKAELNIVGPVDRVSVALALAAQTAIDLAIVTPTLSGKRSGSELAEALRSSWGVRTVVAALPPESTT